MQSPFKEMEQILAVAENAVLPVPVRTKACEQARNALNELSVSLSTVRPPSSQAESEKRISDFEKRIDTAEQACVVLLSQSAKAHATEWMCSSKQLFEKLQTVKEEKVPEASERLQKAIAQGYEVEQEVVPYSKAKVSGASELVSQIEERVALLERTRTWLYNQQILRLIQYVESKNEAGARKKAEAACRSHRGTSIALRVSPVQRSLGRTL